MSMKKIFINCFLSTIFLFFLFLNNLGIKENLLWINEQKELSQANYYLENNEKELSYQIYDKYKDQGRYSLSAEFNLVYVDRYMITDKDKARAYFLNVLNSYPFLILHEGFKTKYMELIDINFISGVENEK